VGGGNVAEVCSGTSHHSHPRTQRLKTGFRSTTAARRTSSAQGATIAAETAAPRGCWPRDPRSGVGAVRGAIRDITAKQDNETRRGWSSFADTRHITFSKTIGEDQPFRHFLTAVCRRRCPSDRRPQAPQRPSDLRTSATVNFQRQGHDKNPLLAATYSERR